MCGSPAKAPYFNSRPSARGDLASLSLSPSIKISIHAPPRGATLVANGSSVLLMISIHAPPRGATSGGLTSLAGCRFQFTPLREGRQDGHPAGFRRPVYFNSRPSARGDEKRVNSRLLPFYFNSRPSARGDLGIPTVPCIRLISIHAPPRGATQKISKKCDLPLISIHAPPRGATPPVAILKNPVNISIHAPPRGATLCV